MEGQLQKMDEAISEEFKKTEKELEKILEEEQRRQILKSHKRRVVIP